MRSYIPLSTHTLLFASLKMQYDHKLNPFKMFTNLARIVTWGSADLSVTIRKLKRIPMMRPRSTSTRTVAEKVTIQRRPSQIDRERYLETSVIFLYLDVSHCPVIKLS